MRRRRAKRIGLLSIRNSQLTRSTTGRLALASHSARNTCVYIRCLIERAAPHATRCPLDSVPSASLSTSFLCPQSTRVVYSIRVAHVTHSRDECVLLVRISVRVHLTHVTGSAARSNRVHHVIVKTREKQRVARRVAAHP